MKLLKIENNKGLFYAKDGDYQAIDKINKDDLLKLVDITLNQDDVTFEPYNPDTLQNQAHQIIYKNIFEKLSDLKERKSEFIDESERLFLEEYEKYKSK